MTMTVKDSQASEKPWELIGKSLWSSKNSIASVELSVSGCHNLMELPSFFPSLTTLEIDGCQDLEVLPKLPSIINLELNKCESKVLQSIFGSASLTYMRICKISNLECLVEGYLKHFTSLEELQISHLGELTTLSNEIGLQSLLSLKLLEISGCPFLKELPQNLYKLSSLKVLRIWNCPSLVSFPVTGLPISSDSCPFHGQLTWLVHLELDNCLETLEIWECNSLKTLPEKQPSTMLLSLWDAF
ncbi:hypothetical protein Q3G72_000701 [Acer saccharum]|nr:hypothetical protein Q3G72_000701 [Acer saccharum]